LKEAAGVPSVPADTAPPAIDADQRAAVRDSLPPEVLQELLAAFWEDLPATRAALDGALLRGDTPTADAALHTIKGSASSIGYAAVAATAHDARQRLGSDLAAALHQLDAALAATAASDPDLPAGS